MKVTNVLWIREDKSQENVNYERKCENICRNYPKTISNSRKKLSV